MSYYPALKQRLTCQEVAPRYGLKVNASGMALCPFHDEHSPSLKLSRGFHCFGCGAQGDVITFAFRLFEIPPGEAAQKLPADFGIPVGNHSRGPPAARTEMETWVSYAKEILHSYYDLLIDWKRRYCKTRNEGGKGQCQTYRGFLSPVYTSLLTGRDTVSAEGIQRVWKTAKMFSLSCEKCANKR